MKRYKVNITICCYTEAQAETEEEALELAVEELEVCHCNNWEVNDIDIIEIGVIL